MTDHPVGISKELLDEWDKLYPQNNESEHVLLRAYVAANLSELRTVYPDCNVCDIVETIGLATITNTYENIAKHNVQCAVDILGICVFFRPVALGDLAELWQYRNTMYTFANMEDSVKDREFIQKLAGNRIVPSWNFQDIKSCDAVAGFDDMVQGRLLNTTLGLLVQAVFAGNSFTNTVLEDRLYRYSCSTKQKGLSRPIVLFLRHYDPSNKMKITDILFPIAIGKLLQTAPVPQSVEEFVKWAKENKSDDVEPLFGLTLDPLNRDRMRDVNNKHQLGLDLPNNVPVMEFYSRLMQSPEDSKKEWASLLLGFAAFFVPVRIDVQTILQWSNVMYNTAPYAVMKDDSKFMRVVRELSLSFDCKINEEFPSREYYFAQRLTFPTTYLGILVKAVFHEKDFDDRSIIERLFRINPLTYLIVRFLQKFDQKRDLKTPWDMISRMTEMKPNQSVETEIKELKSVESSTKPLVKVFVDPNDPTKIKVFVLETSNTSVHVTSPTTVSATKNAASACPKPNWFKFFAQ